MRWTPPFAFSFLRRFWPCSFLSRVQAFACIRLASFAARVPPAFSFGHFCSTRKGEMKVRSAIKPRCPHCYVVRRGKTRYVYCKENARHKQRQGFHTLVAPEAPRFQFPSNEYCFFASPAPSKVSLQIAETSMSSNSAALNPVWKYQPEVGINSILF